MSSTIVHPPEPVLRSMTVADPEPASAAVVASGWGDRRAWFEFAAASPVIHAFVAEAASGELVGTGVATVNGPVGWIGTIWVEPAWRGRGLGGRLTEATIEAAETAGCRTLVLVATDAGRPLYERLGFSVQTHYRILEAPGIDPATAPAPPAERTVRPWRPADLEAAVVLDRSITGEDRRHLIMAFATPETALVVAGADDGLRGFVIRAPWGGGATIAPDPADAHLLLQARRAASGPDGRVRAGLLAENVAGLADLVADGWTDAWGAPRMIRGEALDWRPDGIWGQFNHAVG